MILLAWRRDSEPALREHGPSTILFQAGEIPDLE
jgi:hypothetical protein